jgi:tetrapyrrole methylase family protein/MazG family protein
MRSATPASREANFGRLQRIVARLRSDDGCPWDREQTLATLRAYLLEESYELLEVMDGQDASLHCEELGDLLFQIVFQTQIRNEAKQFDLAEVIDGICDKLERRHPHVFGDAESGDAETVARIWDTLKRAEGKGGIESIPKSLPALVQAQKTGHKAAKFGFDWPDLKGPLAKLQEEIDELREAVNQTDSQAAADELGDILFAAVNVARHLNVDAELALRATTGRFISRFLFMAKALEAQGVDLEADEVDPETMDRLWEKAKEMLEQPT